MESVPHICWSCNGACFTVAIESSENRFNNDGCDFAPFHHKFCAVFHFALIFRRVQRSVESFTTKWLQLVIMSGTIQISGIGIMSKYSISKPFKTGYIVVVLLAVLTRRQNLVFKK